MTPTDGESVERRSRLSPLWREHRARWTLPVVIIVIIGLVAVIDHIDSHRISQVDEPTTSTLVDASGGSTTVDLDRPWSGFNPNNPAGADSSTTTLLSSVLPSAYVVNPKLIPVVNSDLLLSVEATSTSPLVIQYVINPKAVWSDGVPVSADDFIYAWQSQRGTGTDVDGQPDQVASTLGYRDVKSVVGTHGGKTVTVTFSVPYTDWRVMFDHMVPAHIARQVGWNKGFDTFNPAVDLSAGPFVVHAATSDVAVLIRNPRWWGTTALLRKVTVTAASSQAIWTAGLGASTHAVAQPTEFNLKTLDVVSSMPTTESAVKPSLRLLSLEFDVSAPVTDRVAAREAIAHVIDRTDLLNRSFGAIEPDLVVNEDHLATASQSNYTPSSASGEYDAPDLGTTDRLLRSIGYHQNAAGQYVDAAGTPLALRLGVESGDSALSAVATQIVSELRSAGISVTTEPVSAPQAAAVGSAGSTYDLALVVRQASPYQTATANWYSDGQGATGADGNQDWSTIDDPEVDELFAQAAQALNPVTGGAIYAQIDDQLWDQMVALPLFAEPAFTANGVQIDQVQYNPSPDGILWNLSQWATLKPGPPVQKS